MATRRPRNGKRTPSVQARLTQVKSQLKELQRAVEIQSKRSAAMQAQLDHLHAKLRG
jgi:hypothetical protein